MRRDVEIKYLLLDGGFYRAEIAKFLDEEGIKFILPAGNRVRKAIKNLKDEDVQLVHVIRDRRGMGAPVKFVSHYKHSNNRRFNYVTNTRLGPEAVSNIYSQRWGIETGYRVKDKFEDKTTSNSEVVRLTYLMILICLYNVGFWLLSSLTS